MKYKVLMLSVAVVLLAGCGSKPDDVAASDAACPSVSFYSPLPDDTIRFDFPFHLAKDHIYTVDTGAVRRRIILEYFKGDADQVWTRVTETMRAAGYSPQGDATTGYASSYAKPGETELYLAVIPGPVENAANPASVGSIRISWQLVPASATRDAAAPAGGGDTAALATGSSDATAPATGSDTPTPADDGQPADTGN